MIFNWQTLLAFTRKGSKARSNGVARSHITLSIRVACKAAIRPVMRWHINPVSGRLECRLIEPGNDVHCDRTMLKGIGAPLAVYQRGRALT